MTPGPRRPFLIRAAQVSDGPALGRIRVEAWRRAYRRMVAPEVLVGLDQSAEATRFATSIAVDPAVHYTVATLEDEVVAYCVYGPDRDSPGPGHGEVYALYVDPAHWRAGVGSTLLDAVVAELAADGANTLSVWALTANLDARAFYERCGWAFDGAERLIETLPAPDGNPVPEVRLVRTT